VTPFSWRELGDALAHAAAGGQSLHLHRFAGRTAPSVFHRAIRRGEMIAHLFDQDAGRLETTARSLGVRVVVVEYRGEPRQHVDLCGGPLRMACRLVPPEHQVRLTEILSESRS
jgi:hypothetical protein